MWRIRGNAGAIVAHLGLCCAVPCSVCPNKTQVRYSETPGSVLAAANKLGGGKAQPALQLVGYEDDVEAAIKYAFGSAFVCQVGLRDMSVCRSSMAVWIAAGQDHGLCACVCYALLWLLFGCGLWCGVVVR